MFVVGHAAVCPVIPDDNHPHAIDLGLPSGTKWACCNVNTDNPEHQSPANIGGYYAWGETETKSSYDWNSYVHCDGSEATCHDIGSDIAGTEYDVAHVRWGGSWVMPSKAQIEEMVSKCTYTEATVDGVDGGWYTGPSGGAIFLPVANIRWDEFLDCFVLGGYYWSSTQSPYSHRASRLYIDISRGGGLGQEHYGHGLTVRPVIRRTDNGTTDMNHPKSSAGGACQAVFNLCGIKVADTRALPPGLYIVNGRKVAVR